MIRTEWGVPKVLMKGFKVEDVQAGKISSALLQRYQ